MSSAGDSGKFEDHFPEILFVPLLLLPESGTNVSAQGLVVDGVQRFDMRLFLSAPSEDRAGALVQIGHDTGADFTSCDHRRSGVDRPGEVYRAINRYESNVAPAVTSTTSIRDGLGLAPIHPPARLMVQPGRVSASITLSR